MRRASGQGGPSVKRLRAFASAAHLQARRQDRQDEKPEEAPGGQRIDCDIIPRCGGTHTRCYPISTTTGKSRWSAAHRRPRPQLLSAQHAVLGPRDWRTANGSRAVACDGATRRFDQLGSSTRSATSSTARRRCSIPTWRRASQGDQRLDRAEWLSKGSAAERLDCGADAGSDLAVEEIERRAATIASSPCWCWRRAKRCRTPALLAGLAGCRETQAPVAIHAAARIAPRRVRSAGRPIVRYISPKRRRFSPDTEPDL